MMSDNIISSINWKETSIEMRSPVICTSAIETKDITDCIQTTIQEMASGMSAAQKTRLSALSDKVKLINETVRHAVGLLVNARNNTRIHHHSFLTAISNLKKLYLTIEETGEQLKGLAIK